MNLVPIFVCAYLVGTLASVAGIGGGGMLIPLYVLIGNIDIKQAILLSIVTIAGSSFTRTLFYVSKKHRYPYNNRYLPNFNVIRLIIPFDGNTAYLGFLLNRVLPSYAMTVSIVLLLGILTYKTSKKAYMYVRDKPVKDSIFITIDNIEAEVDLEVQVPDRLGDTKVDLFNQITYILLSFGLITFMTILRETLTTKLGQTMTYLSQFLLVSMFSYMTIIHIYLIYQRHREHQYNFVDGDIVWNPSNFFKYGSAASFVGMVSTMLGIGGGMIMNPIMIGLKMQPEVVVATTSITSFFSSMISASQFLVIEDTIEWYFPVLFGIGCLSALTSFSVILYLRNNTKFVITCILAVTLLVSMIMLVAINIIDILS